MKTIKFSYDDEEQKHIELSMNAEDDPHNIIQTLEGFLRICGIDIKENFSYVVPTEENYVNWYLKFKVFLIRNSMLGAFVRNLNESKNFEDFRDLTENEDPTTFIDGAFDWENTPEGVATWDALATKWNNVLDNEFEGEI